MTSIAPHITVFLQQYLPFERGASVNTCDSYAYAFKLLLEYASKFHKIAPSQLDLEHLDAPLIVSFLNHLEKVRSNRANSRNIRLAAIKSFMHFIEYRVPTAIEQVRRILAIPSKKTVSRLVRHLTVEEMQAILNAPDPTNRAGIRDRAMLHLCFAGGLRVSELIGLRMDDLNLQPNASILVHGKGRRQRCLPLWKETVSALRAWLSVRGTVLVPELFFNARGLPMTRAGFEYILLKHSRNAANHCPSLLGKRVSPHVLRHSRALSLYRKGVPLPLISEWLGHSNLETTLIYAYADTEMKRVAIEKATSANHPLRTTEVFDGTRLDDDTLKRLYGLI